MAKKKSSKDYFGLPKVVSIILALIPVTALFCGAITRFMEGKIVAGLVRIIFGWNIVWLVDFIMIVLRGRIWRVIPC